MMLFKRNMPIIKICDHRINEAFSFWIEKEEDYIDDLISILLQMGFSNDSKLILNGYNETENSFVVSDKVYKSKIVLKNSSGMYNPELLIENDDTKILYEYIISDEKLFLVNCDLKNDNVKEFYFDTSDEGLIVEVKYNSHLILINLKDAPKVEIESYNIKNQGVLFNMLSKIEFPVSILELFKKIYNISFFNKKNLSFLSINIYECNENNKYIKTDSIEVKDGVIKSFYILSKDSSSLYENLSLPVSKEMRKFLAQFCNDKSIKRLKKRPIK